MNEPNLTPQPLPIQARCTRIAQDMAALEQAVIAARAVVVHADIPLHVLDVADKLRAVAAGEATLCIGDYRRLADQLEGKSET